MTTEFTSLNPSVRARIANARKQLDRLILRMQGRIDGPNVDRVVPWLIAIVLFAMLLALALAKSRSIDMGRDLALYMQSTWLLGEGYKPITTLGGGNLFSRQASFILYPIAAIVKFLPRVTTLLALQSLALAITVVPLWRLARGLGKLRVGATSAVVFAYFVYTAVHSINLAGFHPGVFALPALVAAVRYGLEGRRWPFVAMIVIVLACRADLGLAVAGLGLLLAIEGRRREGIATISIGLGWLILAIFVVQPALAGDVYPHVQAFSQFGTSPLEILWGIVRAPHEFLGLIASRENFLTVVTLLAPVIFLPVVAPRYLMPAIPLYMIYLAADVPFNRLGESAQTIPITAFVFVATVFALQRSGRILVERVNVDRRVAFALVLTAIVFFVRDAPSSPYNSPWSSGRVGIEEVALKDAAAMIPADAPVRASDRLLPLLAERIAVFELDRQAPDEAFVEAATDGVDWIILDGKASGWTSLESEGFATRIGRFPYGYKKIYDVEQVQVYEFTGIVETPTTGG